MKLSRLLHALVSLLVFMCISCVCWAGIDELTKDDNLVGKARMEYLWWDVYDIRLFAAGGHYHPSTVYALELNYLRSFSSKQIAKRSVKEIKNLGLDNRERLRFWEEWLTHSLPDVKEGESLVGVKASNSETRFYMNNKLIAQIDDADFTRYFFSIWLDKNTSEPELRKQLLGEASHD